MSMSQSTSSPVLSVGARLLPLAGLILAHIVRLQPAQASLPDILVSGFNSDNVVRHHGDTGALIGEFAASGGGGLEGAWDATFGPDGNLYVASSGTHEILRFDGGSGAFMDTFASGGALSSPIGAVFGPDGNLYVTGAGQNHVLRYNGQTGAFIDTFTSGIGFGTPRGLIFGPDNNLYVASFTLHDVRRYDGQTGTFLDVFVPAGSGGLHRPGDLVFGPSGNLYVASRDTDNILRYDGSTGTFVDVFASGINSPIGLTFGPDANLYASSASGGVLRFDGMTGQFVDVHISPGIPLVTATFLTFVPEPASVLFLAFGALLFTYRGTRHCGARNQRSSRTQAR